VIVIGAVAGIAADATTAARAVNAAAVTTADRAEIAATVVLAVRVRVAKKGLRPNSLRPSSPAATTSKA